MKKPNFTKLTVHRETLRALTGIELTRVAGGDTSLPRESGAAMCPAPGAAQTDSFAAVCPGTAAIAPHG